MIPSIDMCFHTMDRYMMLENIRHHSVMVARVAHLIAVSLVKRGFDISMEKTVSGALLHDIGKTPALKSGEDHSKTGWHICIENNFPEIANIVEDHIFLKSYQTDGRFTEEELVYYSDKRVNHDIIVSLDERLSYIIDRYGNNDERRCNAIRENFQFCKKIEKRLFTCLDFKPEALALKVKEEGLKL